MKEIRLYDYQAEMKERIDTAFRSYQSVMVQMPTGIPVATVAIGGAKNAAILAAEILALQDTSVSEKLDAYRKAQAEKIYNTTI